MCGGDVTLNGGDVTSKRDDGTSLWLSSSDDDSQAHKQSEHSSSSDSQHESVTNIDAPPSYEQLTAPAAHAYSHARLPAKNPGEFAVYDFVVCIICVNDHQRQLLMLEMKAKTKDTEKFWLCIWKNHCDIAGWA